MNGRLCSNFSSNDFMARYLYVEPMFIVLLGEIVGFRICGDNVVVVVFIAMNYISFFLQNFSSAPMKSNGRGVPYDYVSEALILLE